MEEFALRLLFEDEQPEACERIEDLCTEIRELRAQHQQKFWDLLRMPITPATVVSTAASIAAWMQVIRQEWALGATALSVAFGYCKIQAYLQHRSDFLQTREMIASEIRTLLPQIHERDILQVRFLLDELPELKDECSDC